MYSTFRSPTFKKIECPKWWTSGRFVISYFLFFLIKLPGYNPRIVKTVTTVKKNKIAIFYYPRKLCFKLCNVKGKSKT